MLKSAAEVIDLTLSDDEVEGSQVRQVTFTKPTLEESKADSKEQAPSNHSPP